MSRTFLTPCLLALACIAALPAHAATPIDQTRPLDPRGRIEIDNLKGRVEVRAWDRPEVKITGSLGAGVEKLLVEGDRGVLRVEVKYPSRARNTEPTTLILQVPLQADLEIETVAASIDVHGMASRELSLESVSGDITANGAPRRASVESVSGDVRLTFNSGHVSVDTVSGDLVLAGRLDGEVSVQTVAANIDVHGMASRELSLESVSGDITANGAPRRASVESVSGDVRLTFNSGHVSVDTVSGDLVLAGRLDGEVAVQTVSGNLGVDSKGERLRKLSAGTVSGDAKVALALADDGEVDMESVSGDLTLTVPRDLSARVSGESFSGDLRAPGARIQREEFGPGSSFSTRYGAGRGQVRLETFSGDAELRLP